MTDPALPLALTAAHLSVAAGLPHGPARAAVTTAAVAWSVVALVAARRKA